MREKPGTCSAVRWFAWMLLAVVLWVEDPLDHTIFRKDIQGQVYNALYTETFDFYALSRKP